MSERPARTGLRGFTALATAALLALGGASTAFAQDDPTSTTPAPTETVTPPPSSNDPEPPSSAPAPTTPSTPSETPDPPVVPPATTVEPVKPAEQPVTQSRTAPDLRVSVRFGRPEYSQGEALDLTVTVHNAGDAPANQIRFASEPFAMHLTTGVDDLVSRPTLQPGETKTIKLGGSSEGFGGERIAYTLRAYVEGVTDKAPNDNEAQAETKLVRKSGQLSGVVYEDRNNNGLADPDEGVSNGYLKLVGGPEFPGSQAYIRDGGRFSIWGVPVGTYQARYSGYSSGLTVKPGQLIVIRNGESTEVALQLGPPLSRSLEVVGHAFDKPKYTKGSPISVSVTLRNKGTAPISKLVAVCDPENDPATLDGTGDGWGELRPDRGGVTIEAGKTETFTIHDTVPDADYPAGKVYFACAFSIDGRNIGGPSSGPGASDPGLTVGADVAGIRGRVTGRVLSNGAPVTTPVKVVAFSSANRIVGDGRTYDLTGSWWMANVPQGKVALKVVGRWQFADGSAQRFVDIVGDQEVAVDLDVVPGPDVKDPMVFAPDLKVTVAFDKETYDISDPVRMTLKVENVGTGRDPARGSWHGRPINEEEPYFSYEELSKFTQAPIELWPGESKQITLSGRARDGGMDPEKLRKLSYLVQVGTHSFDLNPENNKAEARANVTWGTGSMTTVVYGDRNLNGHLDAGEELANREVRVGGGKPHVNKIARTDASGRVRFTGLPAGSYSAWDHGDRDSGWVDGESNTHPSQRAVVNPGDEGTAQVRLIRALSDKLKVSMTFDQPSYPAGSPVGITASITNGTEKPIHVKAECGGSWSQFLGNETPEWGVLMRNGLGVEIAAGATYVHRVTTAMPEVSPDHGYVGISCGFGPEGGAGNPWVAAQTKVPGATQTFRGAVVTGKYPDHQPVPYVKLVLLDPDTNQPVASTFTDADGTWTFADLAVGPYKPVIVGPWKVDDSYWQEGEGFVNVRGRNDEKAMIFVEPGPEVTDPEAVATPGGTGGGSNTGLVPVKKIKNTSALANTGVSVLGLVLFGALLVLAGAAMRRKTALK